MQPVYRPVSQKKESDQVIELKGYDDCQLSYDVLDSNSEKHTAYIRAGQCMCRIDRTDKGIDMTLKNYEILDVTVHKNDGECLECFLNMAMENYNRGCNAFGLYFSFKLTCNLLFKFH